MDIIFDVDGTLMNLDHRRKFVSGELGKKDWMEFRRQTSNDTPFTRVHQLAIDLHKAGNRILIFSGRNMAEHAITEQQLKDIPFELMILRPDDNFDPDDVLKSEMLEHVRENGFDPQIVFDDRQQVVDMWRQKGLLCCQVAKGDF
jgi:phosphoglycolate phosphatase-like HAD superfamily hydrolase